MSDERGTSDDSTRFTARPGANDETRFTGVGSPPAGGGPAHMTFPAGSLIGHTYRIEALLARGGMGEVYRARHAELNTEHALKIILPELANNQRIVDLFRREASVLRTVRHDAVVAYDGVSRDENGRLYLVMEFVDGPSLSKLMGNRTFTAEEVRQLRDRLADGLAVAHEKGVIHRDISPDNVILPGGDVAEAKIIDFGISKMADPEQKTIVGDDFAGKFSYVSPEQLGMFGGQVDGRSDIYSLGLVLVAAAQGEPLDMGLSPISVIEARRTVPDLSRVPEGVRADLAAMLQPDPAKRPQSMRELVRSREQHGDRRSARSRTSRPSETKQGSGRLVAIIGAVAVLIVAGGGVGYWYWQNHRTTDGTTGTAQGTDTGTTSGTGTTETASTTGTATQQSTSSAATGQTASGTAGTSTSDTGAGETQQQGTTGTTSSSADTTTAESGQESGADAATSAVTGDETAATQGSTTTGDNLQSQSQSQQTSGAASDGTTETSQTTAAGTGSTTPDTQQSSSGSQSTDTATAATQNTSSGTAGVADQTTTAPVTGTTTSSTTTQDTTAATSNDAASNSTAATTDAGAADTGTGTTSTQTALLPHVPDIAKLRSDAERMVQGLPCSGVRLQVSDAGDIKASGYVSSTADRDRAASGLAALPDVGRVDSAVVVMARPLCDVLDVLRAHTAFDQGLPALDPGGVAAVYREGDHIQVTVTPPASFKGYLYVDYIDATDRYVIHLLPNGNFRPENSVSGGKPIVIGSLPKEYEAYGIQPPFGANLIIAIATRKPLFPNMRPIQESLDQYLPALRASLSAAGDADAASQYAGVVLQPR